MQRRQSCQDLIKPDRKVQDNPDGDLVPAETTRTIDRLNNTDREWAADKGADFFAELLKFTASRFMILPLKNLSAGNKLCTKNCSGWTTESKNWENKMKLALPATEEGILCPHFGHAPRFAVVETDDNTKTIAKTILLRPEMGGHAAVPPWLKSLSVSKLIAGGLGNLAIENLNNHGIDVYYGAPELPVEELVSRFLSDTLVLNPKPCDHTHDHDCPHGDHQHD